MRFSMTALYQGNGKNENKNEGLSQKDHFFSYSRSHLRINEANQVHSRKTLLLQKFEASALGQLLKLPYHIIPFNLRVFSRIQQYFSGLLTLSKRFFKQHYFPPDYKQTLYMGVAKLAMLTSISHILPNHNTKS